MPFSANPRIIGKIILGLCLILVLLLTVITLMTQSSMVFLLAQLVPLALTIPGQLKGRSRAYQWLCFVDMFFLVQGILLVFTPGMLYYGLAETLICLGLFFSAIIFIRASRRAARTPITTDTVQQP